MARRVFVLLSLLLGGCVERALDAPGGPAIVVDFALPRTDGGVPAVVDLAVSNPVAQEGVPCGDEVCTTEEMCCPLSGRPVGCLPVTGNQNNVCPFDDGWRCDGPEDC